LRKVTVQFLTTSNDKDWDTRVSVSICTANGQRWIARRVAFTNGDHFNDNSSSASVPTTHRLRVVSDPHNPGADINPRHNVKQRRGAGINALFRGLPTGVSPGSRRDVPRK